MALAASIVGIGNDFAMDDVHLIANDPRVHSLSGLGDFFREPYWPAPFNRDLYRPLSSLSLALQWAVGGGSPLMFRLVSYALYVAVSVGTLVVGSRLLPRSVALGVALLFAAHPVHVEAVALGVNQSELWVALIAITSTLRYLDVRQLRWPGARDWALLAALYAVACLIKEHALAIPGLLAAAEVTVVPGPAVRERARRLWPGFLLLAGLAAGYLALRAAVLGSFVGSFTAPGLVGQDVGGRTLTMLQVVPEWLRLLFFPLHLQGDYSTAEIEQATRWGALQSSGVVLLAALIALGWRLRKDAPSVPFGLLWAGAALLPVANILVPTGIVMAERTLFLPSVGVLIAAGGLAASAAGWWIARAGRAGPVAPEGATTLGPTSARAGAPPATFGRRGFTAKLLVAVLVAAGVGRSAVRHTDWRDHLHFWERTAADAPLSHKAHHAYGQLLYQAGEQVAGLREYHTAIALAPSEYWLHRELGDLYRARGQCGPALYWYAESLGIEPSQGSVLLSRISCLMQMGRMEDAMLEAARSGAQAPPPR